MLQVLFARIIIEYLIQALLKCMQFLKKEHNEEEHDSCKSIKIVFLLFDYIQVLYTSMLLLCFLKKQVYPASNASCHLRFENIQIGENMIINLICFMNLDFLCVITIQNVVFQE